MRKTKIICTLGPSTDREGIMEALIREGMDVARFNFSHGTHEEQKARLEKLKYCASSLTGRSRHFLIRRDRRSESDVSKTIKKITLKEEQNFTLVNDEIEGTQDRVTVSYKDLYKDVKIGDSILIDDGLVGMEVIEIVRERYCMQRKKRRRYL